MGGPPAWTGFGSHRTAVAGVFDLGNILELIVDRFAKSAFEQQQLIHHW